ncbi:DUF4185 domain-containing protein [Ideonella sp. DXS29W]|uniref:DUF4185 domain-containing protein n=1 Tax=Ideonella lacteola TaxID=2984193 RepID=A0ABU9BK01_9BURK
MRFDTSAAVTWTLTRPRPFAAMAVLSCWLAHAPLAQAQQQVPPIPPVLKVESLGLVQQNEHVKCRDGSYSALVNGRAVWTFNDTCMDDGGVLGDQFIDNTLAWSKKLKASNGINLTRDLEDVEGVPVRFVPFTQGEIDFTNSHQPNELAIWPGHIVPDPARHRALIFFGTVYRGSQIGFQGVGGGIAVMDDKTFAVTRPVQNPDPNAQEPTYMWNRFDQAYTGGYVLEGDMLYNYGGKGKGLATQVRVARVPLADALDISKWQYFDGSGWSSDPKAAKPVYDGGAAGDTVFWNDYLGMYMTVYQTFLNNTVYYRVAYRPEGPWSAQAEMFVAEQGTDPSYAARVHTEYAEKGGKVQYVTYVKNTGFLAQELPLTKVVFGQPAKAD